LRHGDDHELTGAGRGRQILRGMDGHIRAPLDQDLLDFGRKRALAADRTDGAVLCRSPEVWTTTSSVTIREAIAPEPAEAIAPATSSA